MVVVNLDPPNPKGEFVKKIIVVKKGPDRGYIKFLRVSTRDSMNRNEAYLFEAKDAQKFAAILKHIYKDVEFEVKDSKEAA
jgi:hypothetical protein